MERACRSFQAASMQVWRAKSGGSLFSSLRSELFVIPAGDETSAAADTSMNAALDPADRYVVADHAWSPDGTRIAFLVVPVDLATGAICMPENWVVRLP
jgi:hypothetical protein